MVRHIDSTCSLADAAPGSAEEEQLRAMEAAVKQLLVNVGEDPLREGLVDTPRRVAKAWLDMTRGYRQDHKSAFGTALFHEPIVSAGSDGLVIVRDITFAALSEHSLLPFHGRCHIAYVPRHGVVLGLSKLARVTKCLAARLQTQQAFTERLIAAVAEEVQAKGVAAVVQAVHLGDGPAPAAQLSSGATGVFSDPASGRLQEFVTLLRLSGRAAPPATSFAEQPAAAAGEQAAAAAGEQGAAAAASSSLVQATDVLLQNVGEDPGRKGLKGSAARYASWLAGATSGYRMQLPCYCSGGGCSGAADGGGSGSPVAAELGPATPDDHSPDPSDASSDDMSAELPCYLGMAEAAAADAAARSSASAEAAAGAAGGARQQQAAAGLQTFSSHFSSQCEHHLLPFYGKLKLAYLPASSSSSSSSDSSSNSGSDRAALRLIVEMFSKRLQVQERLTHQVADAVSSALGAAAVLVVIESAHMCMVARGVEKHASTTLTTAARGAWAEDTTARAAALEALLDQQPHSPRKLG
ncbi:GTP cyclohydrolase I [Chlorella sorokiniana]|uniref:GTP cyclohydrolase 1 n=1 Tax=Chlorella sorokiniana TaxID=3076 RepID=A0A2P6TMH1_CHLSO|nr:GTP cyclohydrolase I [Chlorella sorokiniana]|eukprot:PRW45523.1 GTP cyclohydrolase I [Chlorella sorokiniana]